MNRGINLIAQEIREDWQKVHYAAEPYLEAMETLESIEDNYYFDSAREVVLRFLCNASTWRGAKAKEIKAELNKLLSNN